MDSGVIDEHASLGPHLFDVAQAQRIGRVPVHADQHHLDRVMQPLDHLAQRLDHPRHHVVSSGSGYQRRNIATEPGSGRASLVTKRTSDAVATGAGAHPANFEKLLHVRGVRMPKHCDRQEGTSTQGRQAAKERH